MSGVGTRVQIISAAGLLMLDGSMPLDDPRPEYIGKEGTITSWEPMGNGLSSPVITLDDGMIIHGYECWWCPIEDLEPEGGVS